MIIISTDRLTIIDTETGGSIFAEGGVPGYRICASYPSCGKRLLTEAIPLDYAKMTMEEIHHAFQREYPCMTLNCKMPKEAKP